MGLSARDLFLVLALSLTCVGLAAGKYQKLCSIRESNDDCLTNAQKYSGGMGGWQKHEMGKSDKYISEIVTDVGKILKKCEFTGKTMLTTAVQDVYTQVVAGVNICVSMNLTYRECGENQSMPCEAQNKRCSILAYKPPSKEPLQESNVSIYCE